MYARGGLWLCFICLFWICLHLKLVLTAQLSYQSISPAPSAKSHFSKSKQSVLTFEYPDYLFGLDINSTILIVSLRRSWFLIFSTLYLLQKFIRPEEFCCLTSFHWWCTPRNFWRPSFSNSGCWMIFLLFPAFSRRNSGLAYVLHWYSWFQFR